MRTGHECLSCFSRQVKATVRLTGDNADLEQMIIDQVRDLLLSCDMSLSPPENAVKVYALIAEHTGVPDPYKDIRQKSNDLALKLKDDIRDLINKSANKLKTAIHYSVAANIIDYGTHHTFDALQVLSTCLQRKFVIDDTEKLISEINEKMDNKILYLADNSGELVLDGLLVEELIAAGCEVTLAVRRKHILNDVTLEDAEYCGITDICRVIDNGTGCPGTPLMECSDEFKNIFAGSDIIISKGQGNFETLSEVDAPIYFLLTVKCPVVGRDIANMRENVPENGIGYGEMILMRRSK